MSLPRERTIDVVPAFVDDLAWVEGSVGTPWGEVYSRWESVDGGHKLRVDVPWNLTGRIAVPASESVRVNGETAWDGHDAAESGSRTTADGVRSVEHDDDGVIVAVGAGSHRLLVE